MRGHDESAKSISILEILNLVTNHDKIVKDCGSKNATYTSPDIQNTLLHIMGGMVQSIICSKIEKAGVFSLMTDESKARAKKEHFNNCSEMQMKVLFLSCFFITFVEAAS